MCDAIQLHDGLRERTSRFLSQNLLKKYVGFDVWLEYDWKSLLGNRLGLKY